MSYVRECFHYSRHPVGARREARPERLDFSRDKGWLSQAYICSSLSAWDGHSSYYHLASRSKPQARLPVLPLNMSDSSGNTQHTTSEGSSRFGQVEMGTHWTNHLVVAVLRASDAPDSAPAFISLVPYPSGEAFSKHRAQRRADSRPAFLTRIYDSERPNEPCRSTIFSPKSTVGVPGATDLIAYPQKACRFSVSGPLVDGKIDHGWEWSDNNCTVILGGELAVRDMALPPNAAEGSLVLQFEHVTIIPFKNPDATDEGSYKGSAQTDKTSSRGYSRAD